jgi:hypothetical protein
MRKPSDGPWDTELIDEEFDDAAIGDVITTSRGERRSTPRNSGEYRRSNRYVEDGYGEGDFA